MKNDLEIKQWNDISTDFKNAWLLLGNGASIALHSEFNYQSLHHIADSDGHLNCSEALFRRFGTNDFEQVLLACWYAASVNQALGVVNSQVDGAYEEVRSALIYCVKKVHPIPSKVRDNLLRAGQFSSQFKAIIDLNYDLTLYWSSLLFNDKLKDKNWFKDAFVDGRRFRYDWLPLTRPYKSTKGSTLCFYPHGNLILGRNLAGVEFKLVKSADPAATILGTITDQWRVSAATPLFVSEGTSASKLRAIYRSSYLSAVYRGVVQRLSKPGVIYGFGFADNDQHILDGISSKPAPPKLAVSVYTGASNGDQQQYCHRVLEKTRAILPKTEVLFYDSMSSGCWCNP